MMEKLSSWIEEIEYCQKEDKPLTLSLTEKIKSFLQSALQAKMPERKQEREVQTTDGSYTYGAEFNQALELCQAYVATKEARIVELEGKLATALGNVICMNCGAIIRTVDQSKHLYDYRSIF